MPDVQPGDIQSIDRIEIDPNVVHLSRNGRHALIHKPSGEWVMINDDAYDSLMRSAGKTVEEAAALACKLYQADPQHMIALIDLLARKNILKRSGDTVDSDSMRSGDIRPILAVLSLTNRCNLRCVMCFADAASASMPDDRELSLEQIRDVLDKLSSGGCRKLYLTGGEPVLRPELFDIMSYARERFERITLQTNGTLISLERAKRMLGFIDDARVALDGSCPEIHDVIRGEGSFDAAVKGIRNLVETGIPVTIDHTLSKLSLRDSENMQVLSKSLGTGLLFGCYRLLGRGEQAKELMMLPHSSLVCRSDDGVNAALWESFGEGSDEAAQPTTPPPFTVRERCNAITGKVSISCHGKAYPCEFLRAPEFAIGSVVESHSLSELLSRENPVVRTVLSRTVDAVPGCKTCDVRYFCDGLCMAESYAHSGSIWQKDPYCIVKKSELNRRVWADTEGI